jgi:hypothetical protein
MKTPHLLASFAVAATAAAADLKDSAQVAREWNETVAKSAAPPSWTSDLSLRGTTAMPERSTGVDRAALLRAQRDKSKGPFRMPPWNQPTPREPLYDAPGPGHRVPEVLPDNMPPGTKEWKYGGGTYYLLPLIPAREK